MVKLLNSNLEELISKEVNKLGFLCWGIELENSSKNKKLIRIYVDIMDKQHSVMPSHFIIREQEDLHEHSYLNGRQEINHNINDVNGKHHINHNLSNKNNTGFDIATCDVAHSKGTGTGAKAIGITVDDCSRINYHLNKVLMVNTELTFHNYTLEVSSPGVERKLFNLLQISKQLGKTIKIKLISPLNDKNNFIGILTGVDIEHKKIFMKIAEQDLCVNYDNIAKANLVYCSTVI